MIFSWTKIPKPDFLCLIQQLFLSKHYIIKFPDDYDLAKNWLTE